MHTGNNAKSAEAIDRSIRKYDPINGEQINCHVSAIDSGVSRTNIILANEMSILRRTHKIIMFCTVACCLHALFLMLKYPVNFFLLVDVPKRNVL